MQKPFPTETLEQLTQVADDLGLSARQVRRYRSEGLLPRPEKTGLGRGRGTEVSYPPGTCEQLRAIAHWRRYDERFDSLRWCLWSEGYPVEDYDVREELLCGLESFPREIERALEDVDADGTDNPISAAELEGPPRISGVRWRSRSQAALMLNHLFSTLTGRPERIGRSPETRAEMREAFNHMMKGFLEEFGGSLESSEFEEVLPRVEEDLQLTQIAKYVREMSDQEFDGIRQRARGWARSLRPDQAGRAPVPPQFVLLFVMFDAAGLPLDALLSRIMFNPNALETSLWFLRQFLPDDPRCIP